MRPAIPPRNITADVVARFLTGESLQSVRANTGVAFDEIYRILQGSIRSLLEQHVSRTRADAEAERQALQRSITEKNQQLAACGTHLGRKDAEIADLRERLQQKEEKLVGYIEKLSLAETAFVDQERTMGEMREEMLGLQEGLEAAKQQISCLTENQMISDNARDQLIQELLATMAKEREEEEDMQDKMDKCRSQQGKLMRQIRTQRSQHAKYVQQTRVKLAGFHVKLREAQERLEAPSEKTMIDMESVVSSVSPVRADIFREMIDLARQPAMGRRYSPNLFHMAVVLLFRSRSAYEFLRNFLPLPAPSTIYEHFHDDLKNSVNRLTSFNQIAGYLDSRITQHPEIAEAAVLAVDAIACTNTFVGMKQVEEGKVAYLFVVYLQPLNPKAKCSPLFIIESPSGMASDEIQTHIDTIIRITQSRMDRVFLASDGDPSYNGRHNTFMALWEQTYNAWGLERVLTDLKDYRGVGPISDMFHLGKNLRARFLKNFLTFVMAYRGGTLSESCDPVKMRQILRLGAPLTDLSQLGKMRDAYPLAIARVEHIEMLFQHQAFAEGVVWLPLCFCFDGIRLENITRSTRLFMLRVSFYMVRFVYEGKKSGLDKFPETSKKKRTTLFTSQWSVRFMDTVLLLIFSLENYGDIALDRESSHPLENFFGFVRMDSNDVNTPDAMTNTIAHTDMVKESYRVLELEDLVPGRTNLAGVHLTEDETNQCDIMYEILMADPQPPEKIAEICLKAVHVQEGGLDPDEQIIFLQFREYLGLLKKAADNSRTKSDMRYRFHLGSSTRIVQLIASHGTPESMRTEG